MNYQETIDYLFNVTPLFQNIGKDAYKEGLDNTIILDNHFNNVVLAKFYDKIRYKEY